MRYLTLLLALTTAAAFFYFLSRLAAGQDPTLPAALLRYD